MEAPTLIDRFDDAACALTTIRSLAEISCNNLLNQEELESLFEAVYKIASQACRFL